jgi:hypothetical protein
MQDLSYNLRSNVLLENMTLILFYSITRIQLIRACLHQRCSTHVSVKPHFEPTLTQKLQIGAFKNHGNFCFGNPQT